MAWQPEWVTVVDGDDARAHAIEPDAIGLFCGLPPETATQRPTQPSDERCHICEWLVEPMMQAAAAEGVRLLASKATD